MLARMLGLTCFGLFLVFLALGRDLSPDEQAQWDERKANQTSLVAALTSAFEPESKRQGGFVPEIDATAPSPTLAQKDLLPEGVSASNNVQMASYTPASETTPFVAAPTSVTDPEKLAALLIEKAAQNAPKPEGLQLKEVTASRVNVRSGPSTSNAVLGQVVRAEIVQILSQPQDGWVKITVQGDGVEGYMAARFLKDYAQ